MSTAAFLAAVLPSSGVYCLVSPKGRKMEHFWPSSLDVAVKAIERANEKGRTVYHACAAFKEKGDVYKGRSGPNARAMRAFWLDIDIGPEANKIPTLAEAGSKLKDFVAWVGLPPPMLVASGSGLHVYWPLQGEIDADTWLTYARMLKRLTVARQFIVDPTRTSDRASILRPVGSFNYKHNPAREVRFVREGEPSLFSTFTAAILGAIASLPPEEQKPPSARKVAEKGVNAEFMPTAEFPPSDADKVANQCAQMRMFRDSQGNIPEPHWYSGIQVLNHCIDGERIIHEWSQGHAAYSRKQTDAKIVQIKGMGPTTCATFESRNPVGCTGCPHRGKISSPIQLGTSFEPVAPPVLPDRIFEADSGEQYDQAVTFVEPPRGFRRTASGITYTNADNIEVQIYPYDLFVLEILKDDTQAFEVCVIRHHLPKEGWCEFTFRSAAVASEKEFEQAMRDNHIKPLSVKLMRAYISAYMADVQKAKKMRPLYHSMGWKNGMDAFVLSDRKYHRNGVVELTSMAKQSSALVDATRPKGNVEEWIAATDVLDNPGMEAHALLFGAGFGAPLMRFTGFEAAMFSAVGATNVGKTSMGRLMFSIYGDYDVLKLRQQDTYNAKIQRIAALGSLPAYVDEMTNIDAKELSEFVYEITQGRSKVRLRIDGTERATYDWNTIVVSSANSPLTGKLGVAKANTSAERMRLFEFRVERQAHFDSRAGTKLYEQITRNYGHAGAEYVRFVVTHQEDIRRRLKHFTEGFSLYCLAEPSERFWIASVACSLFGLKLAHELGLINFNVERVVQWAGRMIRFAREGVVLAQSSSLEMLGHYMNQFADMRLTVREAISNRAAEPTYIAERMPSRELRMRFDITQNTMWVDVRHLERWISSEGEDWQMFMFTLRESKVLRRRVSKTLGAGTPLSSASVSCLELDMKQPCLGMVAVKLVEEAVMADVRQMAESRKVI